MKYFKSPKKKKKSNVSKMKTWRKRKEMIGRIGTW